MPLAVTDRDRWLALALLLAALLLGYFMLVHPWWTVPMQEVGARVDELRERELRIRTQLQQAPQVQRELEAALAQQAQRPGFLPEATVELATAGLVQRLETIVKQASPGNRSCAIANQSPLAVAGREVYPRVVVQVRLQCGVPELASVLHQIESGSPRLFVENLNILPQRYAFQAGENGAGGVDVNFDLYGYLKPSPGATQEPAGAR
jgi:general secretion pathway protein M